MSNNNSYNKNKMNMKMEGHQVNLFKSNNLNSKIL